MDIFNTHKEEEEVKKELFEKEQAEDKQNKINFGITFSSSAGFEVLKKLAIFCHPNHLSFDLNSERHSSLREGERNVFLYILSQLSDELKAKIIIGG